MAGSYILSSNRLFCRIIYPTIKNIFLKNVHTSKLYKSDVDALDTFTTQLLREKSDKWENIRIRKKIHKNKSVVLSNTVNKSEFEDELLTNFANRNINEINEIINKCIDLMDIQKLTFIINKCIEEKICPLSVVLQKLLSFYAQHGDRDTIKRLQVFVEDVDPKLFQVQAKFLHYLAEATWIKGNVGESLKIFEEVYRDNIFLRRKLKLMIKYLIVNVVSERSEAVLVLVINFTENIALKYEDYFLLACVWQTCFLSKWYADQCTAADILDKHKKLRSEIANRIQFVVNSALKNHQTEAVHRLFEILLKHEMKSYYTLVLQSLFNYRYWTNDLRSCTEIIQWSINLNVPLSTIQHEQYVSLLLNFNFNESRQVCKKLKQTQDFQLKF